MHQSGALFHVEQYQGVFMNFYTYHITIIIMGVKHETCQVVHASNSNIGMNIACERVLQAMQVLCQDGRITDVRQDASNVPS